MQKKIFIFFISIILSFVFQGHQASAEGKNLVNNSGFEESTNIEGSSWKIDSFQKNDVEFKIENSNTHSGSKCVSINNIKPNDSRLVQDITVEPGKVYKLSCFVKTENIDKGGSGFNFTLSNGIFYSDFLTDTVGQWKKYECYVRTDSEGDKTLHLWIRLGGFGATVSGKVYIDDVSMELVENVDASMKVTDCIREKKDKSNDVKISDNNSNTNREKTASSSNTMLYIIIGILIIVILILAEFHLIGKREKKNKNGEDKESRAEKSDRE